MSHYVVQFATKFFESIADIEDYMVFHGRSESSVERYAASVYDTCTTFSTFPNRGTPYCGGLPGLRMTHYKADTILTYVVDESQKTVTFLRAFYGGQDWQSTYAGPPDH